MEFNIHFFNVGHGDSILVEIRSTSDKYIVIDSNLLKTHNGYVNPVYEYLKARNVRYINGLIVTHFDHDHCSGVEHFLKNFDIGSIFIPPLLSSKSQVFKTIISKYRDKIKEIVSRKGDPLISGQMKSLASLLHFIADKQNKDRVLELSGPESVLRIPGIPESELVGRVYLPLRNIKGVLHRKLENPAFELEAFPEMNDASIALVLECLGSRILLTGDSTMSQWREHKRQMKKTLDNLEVEFLKVPHHGSRDNNNDFLYRYFFRDPNSKHIFISANGKSHPHREIFDLVNQWALLPHCTNLADACTPNNVTAFSGLSEAPQEMRQFLLHYAEPAPIPCQGDISLLINEAGYHIENSTGIPCVYQA